MHSQQGLYQRVDDDINVTQGLEWVKQTKKAWWNEHDLEFEIGCFLFDYLSMVIRINSQLKQLWCGTDHPSAEYGIRKYDF